MGASREVEVLPRLLAGRVHAIRDGVFICVAFEICDGPLHPAIRLVGPVPPAHPNSARLQHFET